MVGGLLLVRSLQLKKDMESDAKKSEAFKPYNIVPLEAHGVVNDLLNLPEVCKLSNVYFLMSAFHMSGFLAFFKIQVLFWL